MRAPSSSKAAGETGGVEGRQILQTAVRRDRAARQPVIINEAEIS
jgi:hypothetical protein